MPVLQLGNEDARIIALAITYHLGRPGSETDHETLQRQAHGLASVGEALAPRIADAHVDVEVTPYQVHQLDEALLGATNELKQYEIAERRSSVQGFADTLAAQFCPVLCSMFGLINSALLPVASCGAYQSQPA